MTTIHVSAIVRDGTRVLLTSGGGFWELPGGTLADSDLTTDDGISRILQEDFGLEVLDQEFMETYYEQAIGEAGPAIDNVHRVDVWSGEPRARGSQLGCEVAWVEFSEAGGLNLNQVGRQALRDAASLLGGDPAPPGAPVFIVTGAGSAFKSAVVRALCRRLLPAAHVDAEVLRDMVVSTTDPPGSDLRDLLNSAEQRSLLRANVVAIATNCSLAGVRPVIDLTAESEDEIWAHVESFIGVAPVHCLALPSRASAKDYWQPTIGLRIESPSDDAEEVANRIVASLPAAQIL